VTFSDLMSPFPCSARSAAPHVNHKPVTQNALLTILAGSCKRLSQHPNTMDTSSAPHADHAAHPVFATISVHQESTNPIDDTICDLPVDNLAVDNLPVDDLADNLPDNLPGQWFAGI